MATNTNQPLCIFCSAKADSKEHIFPAWMKDLLRGDQNSGTSHYLMEVDESGHYVNPTVVPNGPLTLKGDHRSRKLKVVCAACNNGWMSELQKRSRPVLEPFIRGSFRQLSHEERLLLANWAVMFTMVVEFAHPQALSTPQHVRSEFMRDKVPGRHWLVWICGFSGSDQDAAHFRRAVRAEYPERHLEDGLRNDGQTLIWAMGNLMMQSMHAHDRKVFDPMAHRLRALNHQAGMNVLWPPDRLRRPLFHRTLRIWNDEDWREHVADTKRLLVPGEY